MPPVMALILCVVLVTVLLRIERKRNTAASHALWVSVFWILISGSRPVAAWFQFSPILSASSQEAGSPLDRLVLSFLIVLALLILFRRKINWAWILKDNFWLILLTLYAALSILWSDFPFVSLKRWIKLSGGILMALVVLSERKPLQALESILRRSMYILIPFSLVLIKYFPILGRQYGRWDGQLMWTGVTTHKNSLGELCAFSVFFLIWSFLRKWRSGDLFKTRSQIVADALVFAIAVFLLIGPGNSYSATSIAGLIVGAASLLILYRKESLARLTAAYLGALASIVVLIYVFFAESLVPIVSSILGRDESLTGRADIWQRVLDVASHNPLLGRGYGSFWGLSEISFDIGVGQGHNGYLDVYLALGTIGIGMLAAFLFSFCKKTRRELEQVFEWGIFGMCFLSLLLLYNIGEGAFLTTGLMWSIMVFVSIVFSSPHVHENLAD